MNGTFGPNTRSAWSCFGKALERFGRSAARLDLSSCSTGRTSFGAVDPEKEVSAHPVAINSDQETLPEVYADKDQDWLEGMQQRDVELREKIRLEIAWEKWEGEERERAGLPSKQRDGSGEVGEESRELGEGE
ncbi:MAG: hypothetical protein F9B45_08175 [Phycisphaera sp. RhM]|nr:hypothetical protein [Phycisphaera sp. RhM]